MRIFTDDAGHEWTIRINVAQVKRLRAALGVDLLSLHEDGCKGFTALMSDLVLLVDVLYVLCRDEATQRCVSDEDFGAGLAGESLEQATVAFLAELTDFFPDARARAALKTVVEKSNLLKAKLLDLTEAELEAMDLDSEAKKLSAGFGNGQAPSASTPALSPSANSR